MPKPLFAGRVVDSFSTPLSLIRTNFYLNITSVIYHIELMRKLLIESMLYTLEYLAIHIQCVIEFMHFMVDRLLYDFEVTRCR